MRPAGWELVLSNYIEQSRNVQFVWGQNDCALWTGKYYDTMYETTFCEHWIGKYDSEEGAAALMAERGFPDVTAIPAAYLAPKLVPFAHRGDLIAFNGALGICDGRKSYILTKERGMFAVPTGACQKAWSV